MPALQQAPELRERLQTIFYDGFVVPECISNPLYQQCACGHVTTCGDQDTTAAIFCCMYHLI
jgi:hypothetical protein